jgi:hypothetical protein
MPQIKAQPERRREREKDSPEMLISFLEYALDDVRALSARSGRHLEEAISTLAEDTTAIDTGHAIIANLRQRT